jgi:hypothetical protein
VRPRDTAGLGPFGLLVLLLCAFGSFGLLGGCYAVLLADLVRALGISPGPLGVILFLGAAASVAAMASLGWVFDRPGRRSYLALALLSEGQVGAWSGIYLRDALGLGALAGGSRVAVFYAAMAAGRFATSRAVERLGNRTTLMVAGLLTASGMALALATTPPILAVAGFLLVGLAVVGMVPVAYSVAGDLAPGRAGSAVSVVSTLGYSGFLIGPPLIGGLAELIGLRGALGVVAVADLAVFVLSWRLGTVREEPISS